MSNRKFIGIYVSEALRDSLDEYKTQLEEESMRPISMSELMTNLIVQHLKDNFWKINDR